MSNYHQFKEFESLHTLLDYFKICPQCKGAMNISYSCGPDDYVDITNYNFNNDLIEFDFSLFKDKSFGIDDNYKIEVSIYCDNTFYMQAWKTVGSDKYYSAKVPNYLIYLYVDANCNQCGNYFASSDIEFNHESGKIINIGLERATLVLKKEEDNGNGQFRITYDYNLNKMFVRQSKVKKNVSLPIVELDFSNEKKAIEKLKSLLLFI